MGFGLAIVRRAARCWARIKPAEGPGDVRAMVVQAREHEALRPPIAELIRKASRRPLLQTEFLRLMQLMTAQRMICNGMAQVNFATEWPRCATASPSSATLESLFAPKLSALRGLIEQVVVDQRRKAVVFSQWRNMLRLAEWSVRDILEGAQMRAVFFTGAESQKVREQALVDFHDEPNVGVMFLSDACGVGLNLQRAATCCINLELPWNPAVLEQRIGRIYRIGQTQPIDVYNLVTENGIEARIAELLSHKKAVFSSLFDGTTDEVRFDRSASFLENAKKLVEEVPVLVASDRERDGESDAVLGADLDAPLGAVTTTEGTTRAADNTIAPSLGGAALSVVHLPDGTLRIEAPRELAAPLASLLESLAQSLRASAKTPEISHENTAN